VRLLKRVQVLNYLYKHYMNQTPFLKPTKQGGSQMTIYLFCELRMGKNDHAGWRLNRRACNIMDMT